MPKSKRNKVGEPTLETGPGQMEKPVGSPHAKKEKPKPHHKEVKALQVEASAEDTKKIEELQSGIDVGAMVEHEDALKELRAKRTARRQAKAMEKTEEIESLKAVRKAGAKERFKAGVTKKDVEEIGERSRLIGHVEAEGEKVGEAYSESTLAPEDVMRRHGMEQEAERYEAAKKQKEEEPEVSLAEATPEEEAEVMKAVEEETEPTQELARAERGSAAIEPYDQEARAAHAKNMAYVEALQLEKKGAHDQLASEFATLEEDINRTYGHYPEAISLNPSLAKMPVGSGLFKRFMGKMRNLAGQPADPELGRMMEEWRAKSAELLQLARDAGVAEPSFEAQERIKARSEKVAKERAEESYYERDMARDYRKEQGMMEVEDASAISGMLDETGKEQAFFPHGESLDTHHEKLAASWEALNDHLKTLGTKAAELQAELSLEKELSSDRVAEIKAQAESLQREFDELPEAGGPSEEYNDSHQTIQAMLDSASRMALKMWNEQEPSEEAKLSQREAVKTTRRAGRLSIRAGAEAQKEEQARTRAQEMEAEIIPEPAPLTVDEYRAQMASAMEEAQEMPNAAEIWKSVQEAWKNTPAEKIAEVTNAAGTEDVATAYVISMSKMEQVMKKMEDPSIADYNESKEMLGNLRRQVRRINKLLGLPSQLSETANWGIYLKKNVPARTEEGETMGSVEISRELETDKMGEAPIAARKKRKTA